MKRTVAVVLLWALGCHRDRPAKVDAPQPPAHLEHPTVGAAPTRVAAAAPADADVDASAPLTPIEQAMGRLVTAMVSNAPAGVLACISKRKPTWLFSSGPDGHTRKMKFPYSEVEKGMKTDGDFWYYFFDDDSELVRGVQRSQRWPLVKGTMFVPPEYANDPDNAPAGVRWRKEGDAYVIDAIVDSGS